MGGQRGLTGRASFFIFPVRFAGVAQLVEHFLAKEDVASSSLVTRSPFLTDVNPFSLLNLLPIAASLVLAGCGQAAPGAASVDAEPVSAEVVEIVESTSEGQEAPSAILLDSKVESISPDALPGSYQDPDVPEVIYTFAADKTWEAVWQPQDESRGLLMSGVYMVEDGGVLHLRVLSFGRRESFLGDDWDRRAPPHPRPRAYFRIEGKQLVMVSNNTAQAFTMAPFTAARLVRLAD